MPRSRAHTRRSAKSNPQGIVSVQKGGFAFVKTAEGEFFIPQAKLASALDGDTVEVALLPNKRGKASGGRNLLSQENGHLAAARVVRVIARAHDRIIGRYEIADPFGVVVPADPRIPYDIFTERRANPDIEDGAIVAVRVTAYPTRNSAATGVVEEVLGDDSDERIPIDLIVARYKLETAFSEASLDQVKDAAVDADGALSSGYVDLRDRFVFTVDPADARDFDDALSWERVADAQGVPRFKVGVHIADVSHYVPWASSVDLDARRRATSVYLVDRVIPMLPEALSNDVCSLVPNQDRRAMTVDLLVDEAGRVCDVNVCASVIRSRARLTYDQAQRLLSDGVQAQDLPFDASLCAALVDRLEGLARFAELRAHARSARGGLDFNTEEARVELDEHGCPTGVNIRRKTEATGLVEEAMIAANEAVARYLNDAGLPCVYRVHEQPSFENLQALVPVLQEFDWFARINVHAFGAGNPQAVRAALEFSSGKPEELLVSTLILRAMKRAAYEPECSPHYGLASDCYCHFTSPIRRYPDLVVHRMVKAALFGKSGLFDQQASALSWIAEHSSEMERTAERAAADSQDVKLVEYLEQFMGCTFDAYIAGVATYGLFVRLDNTAQGLVPTEKLGDEYFSLDPVRHILTGSDTGVSYRLGQRVCVVLIRADHRVRQLDFRLAD